MYILCQYDNVVGGKFIVNVHYLEPKLWVIMSDLKAFRFDEAKECLEGSAKFLMWFIEV